MSTRKKTAHISAEKRKDDNKPISTELSDKTQRQKLFDEIAMLREYISLLESAIEIPKFGQLQETKKSRLPCSKTATCVIPDVQTELCHDLYRFLGLRCAQFENKYVFEFLSTGNIAKIDLYAIEILIKEDGHGKLGKWVLPMSIDMFEILSQHPIDDLSNMNSFLKSCKHHIDCYTCRVKQLEEFQKLHSSIRYVHMSHNIGITHIQLMLSGVEDIHDNNVYNITLNLCYNHTETRPHKLCLDVNGNEKPSEILLKRLNKYLKPFLKKDLSSALSQIIESKTDFIWNQTMKKMDDEDDEEICSELDDETAGFLTHFRHDDKKPKKNKNKRNVKNSIVHDDEANSSLLVNADECDDNNNVDSKATNGVLNVKETKLPENKRPMKARAKSRDRDKSPKNRTKSKKQMPKVKAGNKKNITRNAVTHQRKSKRHKTDANDIRTEEINENVMSDVNNYDRNLSKEANDIRTEEINENVMSDVNNHDRNLSKEADDKHKFKESNNANGENLTNSREIESEANEKDEDTITGSNNIERMHISSSTPLSENLPNKKKFFSANRISEISFIVKPKSDSHEEG